MGMEDLVGFVQGALEKDFGYEDDQVIDTLQASIEELTKAKMATPPGPTPQNELPSKPFGLFVPPSVEKVIGKRTLDKRSRSSVSPHRSQPTVHADGGHAVVPVSNVSSRISQVSSNRDTSPSVEENYDTGTEGNSKASYGDYQSSRTSFPDDGLSVGTSTSQRPGYSSFTALNETLDEFNQMQAKMAESNLSPVQHIGEPDDASDYDNLNTSMTYEQDLEQTLESLAVTDYQEPEPVHSNSRGVTVLNVNGYHESTSAPIPPSSLHLADYTSEPYSRQRRTPQSQGRTPVAQERTPVSQGRTPVSQNRTPVALTPVQVTNGNYNYVNGPTDHHSPTVNGYPDDGSMLSKTSQFRKNTSRETSPNHKSSKKNSPSRTSPMRGVSPLKTSPHRIPEELGSSGYAYHVSPTRTSPSHAGVPVRSTSRHKMSPTRVSPAGETVHL